MSRRKLLALDAAGTLAVSVVCLATAAPIARLLGSTTGSVRVAGALLLLAAADAAIARAVDAAWAVTAFVVAREVVALTAFAVGLRNGFGPADVAVGLVLVDAVALGVLELRTRTGSALRGAVAANA